MCHIPSDYRMPDMYFLCRRPYIIQVVPYACTFALSVLVSVLVFLNLWSWSCVFRLVPITETGRGIEHRTVFRARHQTTTTTMMITE